MDIETFVERSLGEWRSQRSAHHLAFAHFEEVLSTITIEAMSPDAPGVLELCQRYGVAPDSIVSPFKMSWRGESDWDEEQVIEGSTILVPVPTDATTGKLIREQGYAETMESMGTYSLSDDGTFILTTAYERAAAEEKIWFATPNLRFRVSLIKTSSGKGVTTASFSSEVRRSSGS